MARLKVILDRGAFVFPFRGEGDAWVEKVDADEYDVASQAYSGGPVVNTYYTRKELKALRRAINKALKVQRP